MSYMHDIPIAERALPRSAPPVAQDVVAELGYLVDTGVRPYVYMYPPASGAARSNGHFEQRRCLIRDARPQRHTFTLDRQGFDLLDLSTQLRHFDDPARIATTYYAEIEEAARALCDGRRARVFDHQIRRREAGRPPLDFGRPGDGTAPSALGRVHNDYSEDSAQRRLRAVFPDAAPDAPFLILNFWRPLVGPILDTPLALCDARSVRADDWVETDLIYRERIGEINLARHHPGHRWYYYAAMQPHEVLVFVSYASPLESPARISPHPAPRMTPHCAFDLPDIPADAPPRQSIETRCLILL